MDAEGSIGWLFRFVLLGSLERHVHTELIVMFHYTFSQFSPINKSS